MRNKSGAYESGKLFAVSFKDAAIFGKNNFMFDNLQNTLIKVKVPEDVYFVSISFEADGMEVVFVEKEYLNLLRACLNLYQKNL